MSAWIIKKVICPPTRNKIEETFFCLLNPNDFVPFVPCHHLLAKAIAVALQEFWLLECLVAPHLENYLVIMILRKFSSILR